MQVVGQFAASCGLVDAGEAISASGLAQRYKSRPYDIMRAKVHQAGCPGSA
jgi:hypothetical protein